VIPQGAALATEDGISRAIIASFGSALETVSIDPVVLEGLAGDEGGRLEGFRVDYVLRGCSTHGTNYIQDLQWTRFAPPLRPDPSDTRDWMDVNRFIQLLRAYGRVTDRPFGALETYESAQGWECERVTIDGRVFQPGELWVVTPGSTTVKEFLATNPSIQDSTAQYAEGYVFWFPRNGAPEFVQRHPGLGKVAGWDD
jgi:hypothetical protein